MANNRLYIRCKQCGEVLCIGKHCCGDLYVPLIDEFSIALNNFYHKHCYCGQMHYALELCEEFPGEMTDNNIDSDGNVIWWNHDYSKGI